MIPAHIEETLSRRNFLCTAGLLAVTFSTSNAQTTSGPYPDPSYKQLDSWIVIHPNSTATFYVGKTDCGQGTGTAYRQMMCDELDLAYDRSTLIMGSSDTTVDQGGSGGSDGIQVDGWPMRRAAAEARRVLLDMAMLATRHTTFRRKSCVTVGSTAGCLSIASSWSRPLWASTPPRRSRPPRPWPRRASCPRRSV